MKSLRVKKGDTTPELDFDVDKMEFLLEGESRSEDVLIFYEPIINWLTNFKEWFLKNESSKKLDFHFKLEYYNSLSAKFIFSIFKILKEMQVKGLEINVFWFYDVLDEDLLECGEEYEKILGFKFEYIAL
ncbi:MAG: DUF1987 domain-containing protein [Flavobacteriales bacterium]|mgnify:FL=1|nr:DUF1987 domain-containing protein [Flavobacteriales bacterium]|tara:strand:- start:294 stop:683 length:390 start_codon:yes stop_codon:yes gene_type:complete